MDYKGWSKEKLIEKIKEVQMLNRQLLDEKEQETKLEYAWTGNLGHWYWDIRENKVTFNILKATTLGYLPNEIPEPVTYQFFTDKLHPQDYENTMNAMREHVSGKTSVYEVEYRILCKDKTYKWYYDRGKITQYDADGQPLFLAGIVFDVTEKKELMLELERKNKILEKRSSMDGLTQLLNHRALIEQLNELIKQHKKTRALMSIVLFDIDDFKKINDSKGHLFGDEVLRQLAKILQNSTRDIDLAGRYGGEEFLLILPDADIEEATAIAHRVCQTVRQHDFGDNVKVTISGGVAQSRGERAADLIHGADERLYEAKRQGKNRIVAV